MVVLAASASDQMSTYHPDGKHGLLTYFLLKGLRGEADADKDRSVTTAELFSFVQPAVEREAGRQNVDQQPVLSPKVDSLGDRAGQTWIRLGDHP